MREECSIDECGNEQVLAAIERARDVAKVQNEFMDLLRRMRRKKKEKRWPFSSKSFRLLMLCAYTYVDQWGRPEVTDALVITLRGTVYIHSWTRRTLEALIKDRRLKETRLKIEHISTGEALALAQGYMSISWKDMAHLFHSLNNWGISTLLYTTVA